MKPLEKSGGFLFFLIIQYCTYKMERKMMKKYFGILLSCAKCIYE